MMARLTARSRRAVRGVAAVAAGVGLLAAALLVAPGWVGLPVGLRAAPAAGPVWGENLQVDTAPGAEPFLTDPALRTALTALGVGVIRLPVRGSSPSSAGIANWVTFQAAATAIKTMGATPMVILRNPQDPTLLADDTTVVRYVTGLFGSAPVDYEWANETDYSSASHVSAATYVASWNRVVPALKPLAGASARWIGPVTAGYNPAYLRTFLQSANPPPDAVSWHEYTCRTTDSPDTCVGNIQHWAGHVSDAQAVMAATVHTTLPVYITEWNYNAVIGSDPKANDPAFLTRWTSTAVQALTTAGVAVAVHYNVDGKVPLVDSHGSRTPQGTVLAAAAAAGGPTPVPGGGPHGPSSPADSSTEPTSPFPDEPSNNPASPAGDPPSPVGPQNGSSGPPD